MIRTSKSIKVLVTRTAPAISDATLLSLDNRHLGLLALMMVPLRRHVIKGEGRASTVHVNVTLSPRLVLVVVEDSLMIGNTMKNITECIVHHVHYLLPTTSMATEDV